MDNTISKLISICLEVLITKTFLHLKIKNSPFIKHTKLIINNALNNISMCSSVWSTKLIKTNIPNSLEASTFVCWICFGFHSQMIVVSSSILIIDTSSLSLIKPK